jgi:hypothetical protein
MTGSKEGSMRDNHKVPEKEAKKWIGEFSKLKKQLKLNCNHFFMEKQTWEILAGADKSQRIRVYFGFEAESSGKLSACAYVVSTIRDEGGSFRDQTDKIIKLDPKNLDYSSKINEVIGHIKKWNDWRNGLIEDKEFKKVSERHLFPAAFLLHSQDLAVLFSSSSSKKIKVEFGLDSGINFLLSGETNTRSINGVNDFFDFADPCPPYCDPESPFII